MHRLVDSIHGNKLFVFFQSIDDFFGSFHCLFCDIAGEFMFLLQIFDCFLIDFFYFCFTADVFVSLAHCVFELLSTFHRFLCTETGEFVLLFHFLNGLFCHFFYFFFHDSSSFLEEKLPK